MRRTLAALVVAAVLAALLAVTGSTSTAGVTVTPLRGRIYDVTTNTPVANATVRMWTDDEGPGSIVGSDSTDADGYFEIVPSPVPEGPVWVQLVGSNRLQGGFVGGDDHPTWVQFDQQYADTYPSAAALGKIFAIPSFIRGTVVNSRTRNPVRNVRVTLRDAATNTILDSAVTDGNGRYAFTGIEGEEFNLRYKGSEVGYETGYRACNAQVVPTVGQACGAPIGRIGRVFLDRL